MWDGTGEPVEVEANQFHNNQNKFYLICLTVYALCAKMSQSKKKLKTMVLSIKKFWLFSNVPATKHLNVLIKFCFKTPSQYIANITRKWEKYSEVKTPKRRKSRMVSGKRC